MHITKQLQQEIEEIRDKVLFYTIFPIWMSSIFLSIPMLCDKNSECFPSMGMKYACTHISSDALMMYSP